ncbi:uncharacterized protein N7498_000001 [Penicillium cinerascens]|uniref:Uncharacterized protein n=1 Tax=Penicillium cinerascens TaxID=70096 RepID=A0A9W9NDJ7_9EURO|nr:uncharacterized protein N7498_000001 [Penicillium cinerascens]KAJ5217902.1 hypothetical protein N7498_000001 [Penicillium cinerascens]
MVFGFEQAMLLRGARIIRSPTTRRDITFWVSYCPPNSNLIRDFALPGIREAIASLDRVGRAIIYCCVRGVADKVGRALDAPVYHSQSSSVEEKA